MAHTNQQRKRIRQNKKQQDANKTRRTRVASTVKKFETTVKSADKPSLFSALRAAMSELAKAAQKGAISKGSAARKISRMTKKSKAAQA
jgi:small subunit ribosomal protein S20